MVEGNNIVYIDDIDKKDNKEEKQEQVITPISDLLEKTNTTNVNQDVITELPSWDINPPLEINRGEK